MKKIEIRADGVVVSLTPDDLLKIISGLRETLEVLEDWEFQTRTGFEREEIRSFLNDVVALLDQS
ncbi:MAG: hypothetical protein R3F49_24230 [Planctomycetota bacterium]